MSPDDRATPLGAWSSAIPVKADARILKPFGGPADLKSASRTTAGILLNREEQKVNPPAAAGGMSRLQDAAALVPEAAAILDEEMAAGMLAAYDARTPEPGSSKIQSGSGAGNTDEWLRDLHDLVDALGNVLPRLQDYVTNAPGKSAEVRRGLEYESIPVLCPQAPVRPGESARISMKLNNDDAGPVHVALFCTDLFCTSGARIPQRCVTLTPNQLQLGPDAYAEVALEIAVPPASRPGAYCGLMLAAGLSYLRAVIAIEVV